MRRGTYRWMVVGALVALAGCAQGGGGDGAPAAPVEPKVLALSTYDASAGTLVEVYGEGLPAPETADVELVFRGTFVAESGDRQPVDVALPARAVDGGTIRWTTFGPYSIPFGPGNQTGTFEGTIAARVTTPDGAVRETEAPGDFTFHVRPSIVVREFQPTTASCAGPVTRTLGGVPYRLRVEAVGFEPTSFTYSVATPALGDDATLLRHLATGRFDAMGEDGSFSLPTVPSDRASYSAIIGVQATARDGQTYRTIFAVTVRRPLEVFYNGNITIAEIYEPTPTSACMPGGTNGRHVSYEESTFEVRTRTYQVNWNEHWLRSHTVSRDVARTVGWNVANGVGFATTDGQTFHWSVGTSLDVSTNVGISIPELVSLGVGQRIGLQSSIGGDRSRSDTSQRNRTEGVNASETTTDSDAVTESEGGGAGEAFTWMVSSQNSISRGFGGTVIAGTYGVFYRQTLRLVRRAALVAYNQCGAATLVGEVDFQDWAWSPDLALASECPPLPVSNLPAAGCLVEPCDVQ